MTRTRCNRFGRPLLLVWLAAAVAAGQFAGAGEAKKKEPSGSTALEAVLKKKYPSSVADLRAIQKQVRKVVQQVIPCTVGVRIGSSQGSGVIISEDGYVLTAGHVLEQPGREATFILHDGRELKGKTLGANRHVDSGLMKITQKGKWPHAKMAKPGDVKTGQWCISIGHPGGFIRGRAPVVRLGRVLFENEKIICTDCTLVGGDSGGPLFNLHGEVIGVHSRIGWQVTTNFHVPIKTYHDTWDQLAAGKLWGGPTNDRAPARLRPLIGIAGNPDTNPCKISQVFPGSPAQKAGIQKGDVIHKFDGQQVDNFRELAWLLHEKKPRQKVSVELRRGEKTLNLDLTLGGIKGTLPGGSPPQKGPPDGQSRL